ncbi:MAG TPA: MFS transporter [Bacillota bacterium]
MQARELSVLYAVLFLTIAGFGIVFPLLPQFVLELGAGSLHMALLASTYALMQFLLAPFWGKVSDRIGRKPVLVLGLLGLALSFVLMGLARNIWAAILARTFGGVLAAATMPTAQAYVGDATTPAQRGRAMAHMGAATGLGFMVGPMLGGLLAVVGVRTAFFATGGVSLFTAALTALSLREPAAPSRQRAARPMTSLGAMRYAVASPHSVLFWLAFVVTFSQSQMFSMLGLYLAERFGDHGLQTGAAFTIMGVVSAGIQGILTGPLSERYGESRLIVAGLACGTVAFTAVSAAGSPALIFVAVAGAAAGVSLIRPTIASAVSRRAIHGQGVTMGLQSAFDSLGRVLGPLTAGAVYQALPRSPFIVALACYMAALLLSRPRLLALEHDAAGQQAGATGS